MGALDIDVENSKRFILKEIRRAAEKNGGVPLGMIRFYQATGIKIADWRGKLWLRWSDAVKEAGLPPNKKTGPYDEEFLIDKFIGLMRELGHFPLSTELEQKGYHNRTFPSHMAFRARWGSRVQQAAHMTLYCQHHKGLDDILAMCEPVLKSQDLPAHGPMQSRDATGYVCLVKARKKWGTYYKLYRSINRKYVNRYIGSQGGQPYLKNGAVHFIRTDDPEGIYHYWYQRFAKKRLHRREGECYRLTKEDLQAFRSRSVM
jgi:uncharacterized protein YjhX (UPF0386 family)